MDPERMRATMADAFAADDEPSLAALLCAPPARVLPASVLRARLALLDHAAHAYRAELQRRPSHAQAPPPQQHAAAGAPPALALLELPPELVARMLSFLNASSLAACDRVSLAFHGAPPPHRQGLVEQALRLRAAEAGRAVPAALPAGEGSWVQWLLWRDWMNALKPTTVAAAYHLTLFVDKERRLLSCGRSDPEEEEEELLGLLGHGEEVTRVAVPTPIPALQGVRISTVATAELHSLAVSEAGRVFSWGSGILGHGDEEPRYVPTLVDALSAVHVCSVAGGFHHSLAVSMSGALYSWGNGKGHLGHGDTKHQLLPKHVASLQERVCTVATFNSHNLAVSESGALYSWGNSYLGRLGHGDGQHQLLPKRVVALQERVCTVAAGSCHSLAVTESGAL